MNQPIFSPDGFWVWNGQSWVVAPQPVYRQKQTNHILHLLLCVVTFGFWFPVWLVVALANAGKQERIA